MTRSGLKTPKAAAIAGIVFSLLLIIIFYLFRNAVPADPSEPGKWLTADRDSVSFALNLLPFAGVAYLWFIGVLRDRLGQQEDRFFATVFFGSALLFMAMIFVAAAIIGALLLVSSSARQGELANTATFTLARATAYVLVNVYAIKLAGVFLITTSTVVIYTQIAPRWIAVLGYVVAAILLLGSYYTSWNFIVLPAWVMLMSTYILIDNVRHSA